MGGTQAEESASERAPDAEFSKEYKAVIINVVKELKKEPCLKN